MRAFTARAEIRNRDQAYCGYPPGQAVAVRPRRTGVDKPGDHAPALIELDLQAAGSCAALYLTLWLERLCSCNQARSLLDQFVHEARRDVEVALLFSQVAFLVGLIQQQPLLGRKSKRMLETLEDQIPVLASVAMESQRR